MNGRIETTCFLSHKVPSSSEPSRHVEMPTFIEQMAHKPHKNLTRYQWVPGTSNMSRSLYTGLKYSLSFVSQGCMASSKTPAPLPGTARHSPQTGSSFSRLPWVPQNSVTNQAGSTPHFLPNLGPVPCPSTDCLPHKTGGLLESGDHVQLSHVPSTQHRPSLASEG